MLKWPEELARTTTDQPRWAHAGTNLCLDFHGDPQRAGLVVFSDGNHHMALQECLHAFLAQHPEIGDIFYTTTPPPVLLQWLEAGSLVMGNLRLSLRPQLFISPPKVLERAIAAGHAKSQTAFMRSRGNVLLVRKNNPKNIRSVADLARADVKAFLSNPETETPSYQVYVETLRRFSGKQGVKLDFLDANLDKPHPRLMFGERIHHRELPQALADSRADVAPVYFSGAVRDCGTRRRRA
jgi:Bacterial extracellular solute-binding protein